MSLVSDSSTSVEWGRHRTSVIFDTPSSKSPHRLRYLTAVILDPETNTRPIFLTTAVCPGGSSVGGAACHFIYPSWNLYRPVRQKKDEE